MEEHKDEEGRNDEMARAFLMEKSGSNSRSTILLFSGPFPTPPSSPGELYSSESYHRHLI